MQYKQQLLPDGEKLFYAWFDAMHTRVDIAIVASIENNDLVDFVQQLQVEIANYEQIGNRFDPKSEISKVNENAFEQEVQLSPELYAILADCKLYKQKTNGYFDITVYSTCGFKTDDKVFLLNDELQSIRFTHSGVLLDLSGYLKGYVLNNLIQIADNKGFENIIINLGNSSVYAKGNHPVGKGWKINLQGTETEVILQNECLTTSGNSDTTKWPVMNPKNGTIVKNIMPVSVITRDAAVGEVLTKVAYLATENERESIFEKFEAKLIESTLYSKTS